MHTKNKYIVGGPVEAWMACVTRPGSAGNSDEISVYTYRRYLNADKKLCKEKKLDTCYSNVAWTYFHAYIDNKN